MATGNKGSRRKAPPAATASIPVTAPATVAAMTAAEAAPALEAAHAAADVALPPVVATDAIAVDFSNQAQTETPTPLPSEPASNPDVDPAPAAAPATPVNIAEDKTMDATTTAQTVTNDMAQKGQAMFAEANDRAKGAMEKGAQFFAELTAFGKGNVEAIVESSKIAARGLETMGQDAAAYARASFEQGSTAMRTLATVKSPTEFLKLQADFVREAFDSAVAQGSRSTEASLKLAGEVAQPISNRVALAAEKMKVAA